VNRIIRYRVKHVTRYGYEEPAPVCHNKVHLAPRKTLRQACAAFKLHVSPEPARITPQFDYFGNGVHYFAIRDPHRALSVTATSEVLLMPLPGLIDLNSSPPWETVRDALATPHGDQEVAACQFSCRSALAPVGPELAEYALPSFPPGTPVLAGASDLTRRIHEEFKYDPRATTVTTPVSEVLERRAGVCQDFAHLEIACLRSLGLAARYVSGYLRTLPPPGMPRLVGADASHAWLAIYGGPAGWVDFDPTNNVIPSADHLTVAYGRDYQDVCPIQGVFIGGGQHTMEVSVDVDEAWRSEDDADGADVEPLEG
jgi:transglutaminase-like putative cysteine protease